MPEVSLGGRPSSRQLAGQAEGVWMWMARFINQQVIALSSICSGSAESEQAGCGDNQARPTVIDSRSILAGVQGFESLSPHSK